MDYPTKYFIASGKGYANDELVAFDAALLKAGFGNYNLLKVSSILPSEATNVDTHELRKSVRDGSPLLTAYSKISSRGKTPGARIATAVGAGVPQDPKNVGVIMEFSGECSCDEAARKVERMVEEAMLARGTQISQIVVSAVDEVVSNDDNLCVVLFSGIALF